MDNSQIQDSYKSIASESRGLFKDNGSKFIAHAYPVETEEEVKEIVADEPKLAAYVENLYGAEDSKFNLYNCKASAGFLAEYIKTDPKLDEIRAKYEGKLKFKKGKREDESSV